MPSRPVWPKQDRRTASFTIDGRELIVDVTFLTAVVEAGGGRCYFAVARPVSYLRLRGVITATSPTVSLTIGLPAWMS